MMKPSSHSRTCCACCKGVCVLRCGPPLGPKGAWMVVMPRASWQGTSHASTLAPAVYSHAAREQSCMQSCWLGAGSRCPFLCPAASGLPVDEPHFPPTPTSPSFLTPPLLSPAGLLQRAEAVPGGGGEGDVERRPGHPGPPAPDVRGHGRGAGGDLHVGSGGSPSRRDLREGVRVSCRGQERPPAYLRREALQGRKHQHAPASLVRACTASSLLRPCCHSVPCCGGTLQTPHLGLA